MQTTDAQVLRLRAERARGRSIEGAAMKAGMHRNTARKYLDGPLPSEREAERTWRTRADPFAADWPAMAAMLEEAPGLEAKALFEHWQALRPGRYPDGHLRTFQRRAKIKALSDDARRFAKINKENTEYLHELRTTMQRLRDRKNLEKRVAAYIVKEMLPESIAEYQGAVNTTKDSRSLGQPHRLL